MEIRIFENRFALADAFVKEFYKTSKIYLKNKVNFNVALSGGKTPNIIYQSLFRDYGTKIIWTNIHFWWVDERCVPFYDEESNYGNVKTLLLERIDIPFENIHRIDGNEKPEKEALRYEKEIKKNVPVNNKLPLFDLVLLGLGEDGHTASIFPRQMELINSEKICEVTFNPKTHQERITLTIRVINNAKKISFIVTGNRKKEVVYRVLKKIDNYMVFPASHIVPVSGEMEWLLDAEAASLLKN